MWVSSYQTSKRQFGHEQVGVGLVAANLFQREGAWPVAPLLALGHRVACCEGG